MEQSEVQNVEEAGQNQNIAQVMQYPWFSCSVLDAILKSLLQIDVLKEELARVYGCRTKDQASARLRSILVMMILSFSGRMMDTNDVYGLYTNIMYHLPLYTLFELSQWARNTCRRCKSPNKHWSNSYGETMVASYLREIKSIFREFTFETICKIIMITHMKPCEKGDCKEPNIVERRIGKLPSVYTIKLHWQYNEIGPEIEDTLSVLKTRIDIGAIYKYDGDCPFVNYCLVSMVCVRGDEYICVSYENARWVRHVGSETKSIGDNWMSIVYTFASECIRPVILFFEQDMERGQVKSNYAGVVKSMYNLITLGV